MHTLGDRLRYNYRVTDKIDVFNADKTEKESKSVFEVMSMIDSGDITSHTYIVTKPYRGYQMVRFSRVIGDTNGES